MPRSRSNDLIMQSIPIHDKYKFNPRGILDSHLPPAVPGVILDSLYNSTVLLEASFPRAQSHAQNLVVVGEDPTSGMSTAAVPAHI